MVAMFFVRVYSEIIVLYRFKLKIISITLYKNIKARTGNSLTHSSEKSLHIVHRLLTTMCSCSQDQCTTLHGLVSFEIFSKIISKFATEVQYSSRRGFDNKLSLYKLCRNRHTNVVPVQQYLCSQQECCGIVISVKEVLTHPDAQPFFFLYNVMLLKILLECLRSIVQNTQEKPTNLFKLFSFKKIIGYKSTNASGKNLV